MAEAEDVIDGTGGVGRMFADRDAAFMVEQPVDDVRGLTARVVGSEDVDTPSGKVAAWVVEAGDDPAQLARYKIAKATRLELGYTADPSGQRLGGVCQ